MRAPWWLVVPIVLVPEIAPVAAQPAPLSVQSDSLSLNSSEPARGSGTFQAKIEEAGRALATNPQFKNLPPKYLQRLAEFVSGNMLFVLLHELAHAAITEMGLPVLGRMEDAADTFAALRLIRVGSHFSDRVLNEAAKGWFLADVRDKKAGDKVAFYDEHGLNQQRAYHIVCLMVGSDEKKFKSLANETELPQWRQENCAADYSNAVYSWDMLLEPYLSPPGRAKTEIDAIYRPAEGRAAVAQQMARSVRLLQAVTERVASAYMWPVPFTLEMQSCGFPNARWDFSAHKLILCYELAVEFADLYRDYGARAEGIAAMESTNRKARATSYKPSRLRARGKRTTG